MNARLRSGPCVAYLIGAGGDITFDLELANSTACEVVTIDPTMGLAERLSSREGLMSMNHRGWGTSMLVPQWHSGSLSRQDFISKAKVLHEATSAQLQAHGAPKNWRFLNVGVASQPATVSQFGQGYSNAHLSWLDSSKNPARKQKKVKKSAELWTIDQIMHHLGHARVDLVKMDIEGFEWKRNHDNVSVLESVATQTDANQLSFEVHGQNWDRWFDIYEHLMRSGHYLLESEPARRHNGGNGEAGKWLKEWMKLNKETLPFRWKHVMMTNFSGPCGFGMSEFTFYRRKADRSRGRAAAWNYTDAAFQSEYD